MDKVLSLKIEGSKLAQLDALARGRGGRGPFMRQVVDTVLKQAGLDGETAISSPAPNEHSGKRIYLRPSELEMTLIQSRAAERRMTPTTWVMQLVRRHLGAAAPVEPALREDLLNCKNQLQRIGRNINQAARAANKMALADNAAEIAGELEKINDLRIELGLAVEAIGAAAKGDLSYWEVPGERL